MSPEPFLSNTDELIERNAQYAHGHRDDLEVKPTRRLAVVACMDARIDVLPVLGLANGEAHVIRNAGGVITDDVIRSLCLSQRKLGTREIVLIHHTDCGLANLSEDEFKASLEAELGLKPSWALESFADPFDDVRQSMERLHQSPFISHKDHISGYVFDVATGKINQVETTA